MGYKRIAALTCVVGLLAGACGSDSEEPAAPAATAAPTTAPAATAAPAATDAPAAADDGDGAADAKVSVAILLPCAINDLSWCQAAYEGVKELEAEGLIDLQFVENAPFDAQGATRVMSGFANDGVDLIIGHSFDYGAPIHELAPEFPDSKFVWQGSCGGWCGVEGPNIVDYAMNMYEPAYLAGILAGGISQTGVLGTNSGYDIPACRASVEAFLLGAQEVNPAVTRLDAFLGSWIDAALAKEATAAQADQGADVFMACGNANSFGMLAEVAERGLSGFGYVYDESALAPGNVVASMWSKFGVNVRTMVEGIENGTWEEYLSTPMSGGAFELLMHSDFNAAEISAEAMALYETRLAGVMDGTFEVPFIGAAPEPEAAEATQVRVRLNWIADPGFAGLYMADELGYFADEGVEPVFEFGGPNVPHPVQILAGGAADIGFGGLAMIADSASQGEEFVVFGTRLQQGILGISSLAESPIYTAEELCGKKIGATPGDIVQLDALLVINGLEPGCYEMVPVGWDPSPVAEGLVDGMVNYMNSHPVVLDGMGIDNVAVSYAEMGMPMYHDLAFATKEFAENHRDALVGFTRAMVKGWEAAFADPETAMDVMYNGSPNLGGGVDVGMDISYQIYIHYAQVPLMESSLTETDGLFSMSYDEMAGAMWDVLGLTGIDPLPEAADVIDMSILDDAFGDCRPSILACDG